VNTWWISDDTRYSFKPIHDPKRLKQAMRMQYGTQIPTLFGHAVDEAVLGSAQAMTVEKIGLDIHMRKQ
jgi:phage baseplate assembly protein W